MTQLEQFQERINKEIPLTRGLGLQVSGYSGHRITIKAPLALNHNHQGTGFGGSIYSVAVTAAWSLLELWLEDHGLKGSVVIQSGSIDYGLPVSSDFFAQCELPSDEDMQRFRRSLERRGKGRLCLESTVFSDESGAAFPAAMFSGRFVVARE